MGLLAKILGAVPQEEMDGIRLDMAHPFWEVAGETDFPSLLSALSDLLPSESMLYFEGGVHSDVLLKFLRQHEMPAVAKVAYGTIWPKPSVFHLPATPEILQRLADITKSFATPEVASHFHVYRNQVVLLQCHDVFSLPLLLSGEFAEERVKAFAERLQMTSTRGKQLEGA